MLNVIGNQQEPLIKLKEGIKQIMEQISHDDCLAYRIYPEPDGKSYLQNDLMTTKQVEQLFDFCQILEAIIYDVGWNFLIQQYGYKLLYEINNKSGWFDCSDLEEYKAYIEAYRNDMKRIEKGIKLNK